MTVARARLASTERSIPLVKITRCCPIATIAITAVWATMLPRSGLEEIRGKQADRGREHDEDQQRADAQSRRPSETPELATAGPPSPEVEALFACSLTTSATIASPRVFLIDKKSLICRGSIHFLWTKVK